MTCTNPDIKEYGFPELKYVKGKGFCKKMVYKRGKCWAFGRSLPV